MPSVRGLLRSRWVLALGALGMAAYFVALAFFLTWLLGQRATPGRAEPVYIDGLPVVRLDRQGAVLAPGLDQPLPASEVPVMLQELRARDTQSGQRFVLVTAPAEASYRRVYEVLRLCQAVGFAGQELRSGEQPGVRVRVAEAKKGSPAGNVDPLVPSDEELALPAQLTVDIRGTADGGVAAIVVKSIDGEVALAEPAALKQYLELQASVATARDAVVVVAESRLSCAAVAEVLAACRSAGYENLQLALPPERRPFDLD